MKVYVLETIFISKNEIIGNYHGIVNIILSDHYYWYKRKTFPVKFVWQAKKMASSMFLDESKNSSFDYEVTKIDKDEFVFLAYDKQKIIDKLEQLGIDINRVNKIHFAQNELIDIKQDLTISDGRVLSIVDGFVTILPSNEPNKRFLSSILKNIKLKQSGVNLKLDDSKYQVLKKPIIALVILNLVLLIQLISDRGILNNIKEYKSDILNNYDLPSTNFQLKSILKKYKTIDIEQQFIRNTIHRVLLMELKKGDFIQKLVYNKNSVNVEIKISELARIDKYKKLLNSMNIKPSKIEVQGEIVSITYNMTDAKVSDE